MLGVKPRSQSLIAGALLAALLSAISVGVLTQLWNQPLHVPFQYAHLQGDDEEDATLDLMLIKNVHETGWFSTNPKLNAPFQQHWNEWPMGGDLLAYTIKKAIVEVTGDVPLTFNLFWLLTFPLTALVAFPVLRKLRVSWSAARVGAVLFSLAPYHFRNGAGHENLAFYVGVPIIVFLCLRILGADSALPSAASLRHRAAWWQLRWMLLGTVLIGVTGIYYLAFLLTLLAISALIALLAGRGIRRLLLAVVFAVTGLAASALANLPTLIFRAQNSANLLGVPDRPLGVSEQFPVRLVELLSPVTAHRFGPFAWIADQLYPPNQRGLGTAMLGLAAAIGFVVALLATLRRTIGRTDDRGWNFEARIGVLIVAMLALGVGGGISRALELVGLIGIRAWVRIAIVVAFAGIVVFGRLLDRARVAMLRRGNPRRRLAWASICAVVLVAGVLDQASPAQMPQPRARAVLWRRDAAFVTALERHLPRNSMVFQLPVTDFPEHGGIGAMSAHDHIKTGYLHSRTLRWSAGGIRGRSGEWQWPASGRPTRSLVRGLTAAGFSAITLNRDGFPDQGDVRISRLTQLLGRPIADDHHHLLAWDLRRARSTTLAGITARQRRGIERRLLHAPLVYFSTDVDSIRNRGEPQPICATGTALIVNPSHHRIDADVGVSFVPSRTVVPVGRVVVNGRRYSVPMTGPRVIRLSLASGTTPMRVAIHTPHTRCASAQIGQLTRVSVSVHARH